MVRVVAETDAIIPLAHFARHVWNLSANLETVASEPSDDLASCRFETEGLISDIVELQPSALHHPEAFEIAVLFEITLDRLQDATDLADLHKPDPAQATTAFHNGWRLAADRCSHELETHAVRLIVKAKITPSDQPARLSTAMTIKKLCEALDYKDSRTVHKHYDHALHKVSRQRWRIDINAVLPTRRQYFTPA